MIGLCCHYMVPKIKKDKSIEYINGMEEKSLQLNQYVSGAYSNEKIMNTWLHNLLNLNLTLDAIIKDGIRLFRLSSNIFPLFDKVPSLLEDSRVLQLLARIGNKCKANSMRVTSHPSQFVVLSSVNPNVIVNSIAQLQHHAWIFDSMGFDQSHHYAINIHGGARNQSAKLCESIESLPDSIRNRLTLENDESCYSVRQLMAISESTQTPVCFDSHHHSFNEDGHSSQVAMELAMSTWRTAKPLTHLSNTEPGNEQGSFKDKRKHSGFVHYIPEHQRLANNNNDIDIDFEFKQKNLAIRQCLKDFDIKL